MSAQHIVYAKIDEKFKQNSDQWHLESSSHEKKRLETLLEMCQSVPHLSVLEVGCAEGHFTQMLCTISKNVTAIDISPTAIMRARRRAQEANYIVGTIEDFRSDQTYDLVVASEVLYYQIDKKKAVESVREKGRMLVTSTFLMRNYRGYAIEWYLRTYQRIRTKLIVTISERKVTILSIRRLLISTYFLSNMHPTFHMGMRIIKL